MRRSPDASAGRAGLFPSCLHQNHSVKFHTLRRLSLVDSRAASRRPLPPRGSCATFARKDNALPNTVVWPPDSSLTFQHPVCKQTAPWRLHQSSLESTADARHPPFPVGERQSQPLTTPSVAPVSVSSVSMNRFPRACHASDPRKTTSVEGLPPHRVRSSVRLDGLSRLAFPRAFGCEHPSGSRLLPSWQRLAGEPSASRARALLWSAPKTSRLALSSAPLFLRLRRSALPHSSRSERPAARCHFIQSPKTPTPPSPAARAL